MLCYAVFRPFPGTKLLNLGVKFPKIFQVRSLLGDACKPNNTKNKYYKWKKIILSGESGGGGEWFQNKIYTPVTNVTNVLVLYLVAFLSS